MKLIVTISAVLPLGLLMFSHLGAVHPLGDSLAVFRPWLLGLGLIGLALLLWQGHWWLSLFGTGICLLSAVSLAAAYLQGRPAPDAPYSMYQKNLSYRLQDLSPIIQDLRTQAPDFISLQEVTPHNRQILKALEGSYPAQQFCAFEAVGGVAVASRWPKIGGSGECIDKSGLAAMQVRTPDGPVWVVALHLHWPYPFNQAPQVRKLARDIAGLLAANPAPVVLGGDFNMVAWSHTLRRISTASGTRRVGGVRPSFPMLNGWLTLPIDHVLVSKNDKPANASLRPLLGSDHRGLLARFHLR